MMILPGVWTPETERMIESALSTATLADIKCQVENGAGLYVLQDDDNETVLSFVLRVDHLEGRSEGVIVAAGGALPGVDLTAVVLPYIEGMFINCQSIRIHTERVGLAKKLIRQGYEAAEIILTKDISGKKFI